MALVLDGTNGETFPSWTTASRPASPVNGQMGYNTTTNNFDAYLNGGWVSVLSSTTAQSPTSGTVNGSGPAFSAYQSTIQTISNNSYTKVQFQTKEFDTNTNYDNTTNYRFTPTVAGYYQINGKVGFGTNIIGEFIVTIYKNGTEFKRGNDTLGASGNGAYGLNVNGLLYLNGSTDYVEIYIYQSSGSSQNTYVGGSQQVSYFQAAMVRSA